MESQSLQRLDQTAREDTYISMNGKSKLATEGVYMYMVIRSGLSFDDDAHVSPRGHLVGLAIDTYVCINYRT